MQVSDESRIIDDLIDEMLDNYIPECIFIRKGRYLLRDIIEGKWSDGKIDNYQYNQKIKSDFLDLNNKIICLLDQIENNSLDDKYRKNKLTNIIYKKSKSYNYIYYFNIYGDILKNFNNIDDIIYKYLTIKKIHPSGLKENSLQKVNIHSCIGELTFLGEYLYKEKLTKYRLDFENILELLSTYDKRIQKLTAKTESNLLSLYWYIVRHTSSNLVINHVEYFDNGEGEYEIGVLGLDDKNLVFYCDGFKIINILESKNIEMHIEVYEDFIDININEDIFFNLYGKEYMENYRKLIKYLNESHNLSASKIVNLDANKLYIDEKNYENNYNRHISSDCKTSHETEDIKSNQYAGNCSNEGNMLDNFNLRKNQSKGKNVSDLICTLNKILDNRKKEVICYNEEFKVLFNNFIEKHSSDIYLDRDKLLYLEKEDIDISKMEEVSQYKNSYLDLFISLILKKVELDKNIDNCNKVWRILKRYVVKYYSKSFKAKYGNLVIQNDNLNIEDIITNYIHIPNINYTDKKNISLLMYYLIDNKSINYNDKELYFYNSNIWLEKYVSQKLEDKRLYNFEMKILNYDNNLSINKIIQKEEKINNDQKLTVEEQIKIYLKENKELNKRERKILELFTRSKCYTDSEIQEICSPEGIKFISQSVMAFMQNFISKLNSEGHDWIGFKVIGMSTYEYYLK